MNTFMSCQINLIGDSFFNLITGKGDEVIRHILEKSGSSFGHKIALVGLGKPDIEESATVIILIKFLINLS